MKQIRDLMCPCLETIEDLYEKRGALSGVATGFPGLDQLTNGFQPTHLIVIASPPQTGKTAFALNVIDHVATREKLGVAIFTGGTSASLIVQRLLSAKSRVDLGRMQSGFLQESDFHSLVSGTSKLVESSIFIDDTQRLSIDELRARSEQLKNDHDVRLIVIDDFHRLYSPHWRARRSREDELAEVASSAKAMASDLKLPTLALTRLRASRVCGEQSRATPGAFREAEYAEEYADVTGLLTRSETVADTGDPGKETTDRARLKIGKNDHGTTGEIYLKFQKGYLRFEACTDVAGQ